MKVYIASDHAGYELKELIKKHFADQFEWQDLGTHSTESVDYPDFAHPLAEKVAQDNELRGVLICGTGNGVAITANKHANVRAALAWNEDIAKLARQHNDANVLCLGGKLIGELLAMEIVKTWMHTDALTAEKYVRRRDKVKEINDAHCK